MLLLGVFWLGMEGIYGICIYDMDLDTGIKRGERGEKGFLMNQSSMSRNKAMYSNRKVNNIYPF